MQVSKAWAFGRKSTSTILPPFPSSVQTEVTTVVCDMRQQDKILKESGKLRKLKRVVVMDEQQPGGGLASVAKQKEGLVVVSLPDLERKGRDQPVPPSLPSPSDLAVVMYTSGSSGVPKVRLHPCAAVALPNGFTGIACFIPRLATAGQGSAQLGHTSTSGAWSY